MCSYTNKHYATEDKRLTLAKLETKQQFTTRTILLTDIKEHNSVLIDINKGKKLSFFAQPSL